MDESQGLFNLSPDKDKYDSHLFDDTSKIEHKLKEAKDLDDNLKKLELDMASKDAQILTNEIQQLVKDTKLLFKVLDKILPRAESDAISTLLEFSDTYVYTNKNNPILSLNSNIEEQLEEILRDEEDQNGVKRSIKEIRTIRHNYKRLMNIIC